MYQRVRQFAGARRKPTSADIQIGTAWLSPSLLRLYLQQHPRDIVHTAATARWLLHHGHGDPDLIMAALLHDIGKGDQRTRDRVAFVVAGWFGVAGIAGKAESRVRMRAAIGRSALHPKSGATLAERAGASPRVVELIARHHERTEADAMLGLLQQADSRN